MPINQIFLLQNFTLYLTWLSVSKATGFFQIHFLIMIPVTLNTCILESSLGPIIIELHLCWRAASIDFLSVRHFISRSFAAFNPVPVDSHQTNSSDSNTSEKSSTWNNCPLSKPFCSCLVFAFMSCVPCHWFCFFILSSRICLFISYPGPFLEQYRLHVYTCVHMHVYMPIHSIFVHVYSCIHTSVHIYMDRWISAIFYFCK
jgi:hypothetical protein